MSDLYQHFRPEEKEFIDKAFEWKKQVSEMYAPKLTGFLDPRERHIVRSIVGSGEDVLVSFCGGHGASERKRALIHPSYFQPEPSDYEIVLLEIEYPEKFSSISHPQILGSLMGVGLKREKFGDILEEQGRFQFFASEDIQDYIQMNVTHVGKVPVQLKKCGFEKVLSVQENWHDQSVTVSSLRLDAVISSLPGMSRQKAQSLIKSGLAKVNWKTVENSAFECEEGDMLSVRGIGRMKILSVDGQTKKDKWRLTVGILK